MRRQPQTVTGQEELRKAAKEQLAARNLDGRWDPSGKGWFAFGYPKAFVMGTIEWIEYDEMAMHDRLDNNTDKGMRLHVSLKYIDGTDITHLELKLDQTCEAVAKNGLRKDGYFVMI